MISWFLGNWLDLGFEKLKKPLVRGAYKVDNTKPNLSYHSTHLNIHC